MQLNIHLAPAFEKALRRFMQLRGLSTKSEAVRIAVFEALERERRGARSGEFASWRAAALRAAQNPRPRFATDDDIWT